MPTTAMRKAKQIRSVFLPHRGCPDVIVIHMMIIIALKLFLHSDKKGHQWDKPGTVRKRSEKHGGNQAGSL